MARLVEIHPKGAKDAGRLYMTQERLANLVPHLVNEITDALAARKNLDATFREAIRLYEGIPDVETTNIPVEGFKRLEVTIGALSTDTVYAQALDLMTATTPLATVRGIPKVPNDDPNAELAKAVQRIVDWGVEHEWNTIPAADDMIYDVVQLGTSALYTLYQEKRVKRRYGTVTQYGPRTLCVPAEDIIVPGGSKYDPSLLRWVGVRNWLTQAELEERAVANGWYAHAVERAGPAAADDWVTLRRESVGRQMKSPVLKGQIYDVIDIYMQYDIDGDGINEDLLIVYNHTGQQILYCGYNPYDDVPLNFCRYQKRGHLFWGIGVMDMTRPYQREVSDIHNWRNINMFLANCRIWKAKYGSVPATIKLLPSKVLYMRDPDDLQSEAMADVYGSSAEAEMLTMQLAERRVGVNEMSSPRPSQVLGSRTPGITAMTLMQQANKRFVPAFHAMRLGVAGGIKQSLYRIAERIRARDERAEAHLLRVLGEKDGSMVVSALRDESFEEGVQVGITASSSVVNREAEKQNSLLLVNILNSYYDRVVQLAMLASNPEAPPEIKSVATKIAEGAYEVMQRTILTFDQVRDPAQFLVNVNDEMDKINPGGEPQHLKVIQGLLGGGGGGPTEEGGGTDTDTGDVRDVPDFMRV